MKVRKVVYLMALVAMAAGESAHADAYFMRVHDRFAEMNVTGADAEYLYGKMAVPERPDHANGSKIEERYKYSKDGRLSCGKTLTDVPVYHCSITLNPSSGLINSTWADLVPGGASNDCPANRNRIPAIENSADEEAPQAQNAF